MDYAERGDLAQEIKKHNEAGESFAEETIWRYVIQVCRGLQYLHKTRILHRDVKAQNVFLDKDNDVLIGDLGLSRIMGPQSCFAHTAVGTPLYFSPELCQENAYNEKSDIW